MNADNTDRYARDIARALTIRGGHLKLGRGGFSLYYDNAILSGYDCETIKRVAIVAGLPVIDSRTVPFELVSRLAIEGPMVAVNVGPDPRPWHAFSYAPLAAVAAAYRRAGAQVFNVPDCAEHEAVFAGCPPGPPGDIVDFWLRHVRTPVALEEVR
jgi:hypothetical protein